MSLLRATRVENVSALDWLRRAESNWTALKARIAEAGAISDDVGFRIEVAVKYDGYILRQQRQIEQAARLEAKTIPPDLDYSQISGLRNEARQKLARFAPRSLGQALRISGITPADVMVMAIHLERGLAARPAS